MTDAAVLRPLTHADLGSLEEAMAAGDWGGRSAFYEFAIAHEACHPIVGEVDGRIVGTGTATASAGVGWVAMIYVVPEMRGTGLGRRISTAVCDDLEARGCRTLILMASELGRPVYERLDFRIDRWVHLLVTPDAADAAERLPGAFEGLAIRPLTADDLAAVEALDAEATGEDRRHLIRDVLPGDGGLGVVGPDETLEAFRLDPRWGAHPLIARRPQAALALFESPGVLERARATGRRHVAVASRAMTPASSSSPGGAGGRSGGCPG
jgi:GNAT superfamily N-acetyltransferase